MLAGVIAVLLKKSLPAVVCGNIVDYDIIHTYIHTAAVRQRQLVRVPRLRLAATGQSWRHGIQPAARAGNTTCARPRLFYHHAHRLQK